MENQSLRSIFQNRIFLAAASAVIGGSLALFTNHLIDKYHQKNNHDEDWINASSDEESEADTGKYATPEYEKTCREQLVRNYQFFGDKRSEKLRNSFIIVVGVGGVGR